MFSSMVVTILIICFFTSKEKFTSPIQFTCTGSRIVCVADLIATYDRRLLPAVIFRLRRRLVHGLSKFSKYILAPDNHFVTKYFYLKIHADRGAFTTFNSHELF